MGGYCFECAAWFACVAWESSEDPDWIDWAEDNDFAAVDMDEFYEVCEGCGAHAFVRGGIRTHAFDALTGVTLRCPECLGIEEDVA